MFHTIHTIIEEFRMINANEKELRKFGFLLGGVLLLASLLFIIFFEKTLHVTIPGVGLILVILALTFPRLLLWPYYIWMGIAIVLGSVISPIFLAILFFVVLTPVGILKRIFSRPSKSRGDTYWITRTGSQDPKRMEELF